MDDLDLMEDFAIIDALCAIQEGLRQDMDKTALQEMLVMTYHYHSPDKVDHIRRTMFPDITL